MKTLASILRQRLDSNAQKYFIQQEKLIYQTFHKIAQKIDSFEDNDSSAVAQARDVLQQKEKYIQKFGEEAIACLPESAKKQTQQEWERAEKVLETSAFDVPVRIVSSENTRIILPVYSKSPQPLAKELIDFLDSFFTDYNHGFEKGGDLFQNTNFYGIYFRGIPDNNDLVGKLHHHFLSRDFKCITLQPFHTDYFMSEQELEESLKTKNRFFSVNNSKSKFAEKSKNFHTYDQNNFVIKRLFELGYESLGQVVRETSFTWNSLDKIIQLNRGGFRESSIAMFADILKLEEDTIKDYINKTKKEEPAPFLERNKTCSEVDAINIFVRDLIKSNETPYKSLSMFVKDNRISPNIFYSRNKKPSQLTGSSREKIARGLGMSVNEIGKHLDKIISGENEKKKT